MLVGFINNFCRDTLGDKYWRTFAPYLGTVGLYLALANMAGLFGRNAADQRPERHRRSGDHERPADLRLAVPVPRSARQD